MRVSKAWLSYHHTQENGLNNAFSFLKNSSRIPKIRKIRKTTSKYYKYKYPLDIATPKLRY